MAGQTDRQIAREEHRDRATVAKIVKSMEMQELVRKQRERYFALAPLAVAALEEVLRAAEDGRIAREILVDLGVVPTRSERDALLLAQQVLESRGFELMENLEAAVRPKAGNNEGPAHNSTASTVSRNSDASDSTAETGRNSGRGPGNKPAE